MHRHLPYYLADAEIAHKWCNDSCTPDCLIFLQHGAGSMAHCRASFTLMMPARTLTPSSLILHPERFSSAMVWLVRKPSLSTCSASQVQAALKQLCYGSWLQTCLTLCVAITLTVVIKSDVLDSCNTQELGRLSPLDISGSIQAWWLNGRAFDSRSKGCVFKSRLGHSFGAFGIDKGSQYRLPTLAVDFGSISGDFPSFVALRRLLGLVVCGFVRPRNMQ